ncbi:polysaccharide pyruvyl transferase family protein [Paenibacillus oceani]|uniref:Polysaccharide pyruvyl transferase family protein n=1 Tax=Paenibacillus oceani TaxID=2772510 RepID=A0A927H3B6_9BACL|nr:polysaccharide pyruvyl transferase family protein [Paenibacillus oceani]MBD2866177.1 polysaccharide pyruvyl transferase family protein [Paenibacillus oceani]
MANIMLHGATTGANFGDVLFADLFFERIKELNEDGNNYFYESRYAMSDQIKEYLNYNYHYSFNSLWKADALVYFSGGYFGERVSTPKEDILRFLKYMVVGMFFVIRNKPIAILGLGAGPLSNRYLRWFCKKIFNHATIITVRDTQSKSYLEKYGVKKEIIVTSDSAQIVSREFVSMVKDNNIRIEPPIASPKNIFLHINPVENSNSSIIEKIVEPLNSFLSENPEYGVVIGCDAHGDSTNAELEKVHKKVKAGNVSKYFYNNPRDLCALLTEMDVIVTSKLHVGILGATFSKSVISISGHSEKIYRYYEQIGESGRTISLEDCTYGKIKGMLDTYHLKPIILEKGIIESANTNFKYLEEFTNLVRRKGQLQIAKSKGV